MSSVDAKRRISDWFRQWRSPLRRFLGKTGVPRADIDDVAQEVFLRLMRYDRTELIENPQAYVFKVAANVAVEWSLRACHKRPHRDQWLAELTAAGQADSAVLLEQSYAEIKRALNTLTPYQREILKLFYTENLQYAEIAERLGESLRSVRRQFEKSYDRLRQELDPELLGVFTHGRE